MEELGLARARTQVLGISRINTCYIGSYCSILILIKSHSLWISLEEVPNMLRIFKHVVILSIYIMNSGLIILFQVDILPEKQQQQQKKPLRISH